MAMIELTDTYKVLPEGTYIFRVSEVEYNPDFGKLIIKFVTKDGKSLNEMFTFKDQQGNVRSGVMSAFSYLARVCLNDMSVKAVDPDTLVGKFLKATVTHTESNGRTYAHLGEKIPASGYEDDGAIDLDDLLGE